MYWLEEPVHPEDVAGYAAVRRRSGDVLIVGGEQHSGMMEFEWLLHAEAVDVVQPSAMAVGGMSEWLRVYELAQRFGVEVCPWNL